MTIKKEKITSDPKNINALHYLKFLALLDVLAPLPEVLHYLIAYCSNPSTLLQVVAPPPRLTLTATGCASMITTTLSHQSPTTGYQNHFQSNCYYESVHTTLKSACFLDCCIQGCHTFCYHILSLNRPGWLPYLAETEVPGGR